IGVVAQPSASGKFSNIPIRAPRIGNIIQTQIELQGFAVNIERNASPSQTLQFAPEIEAVGQQSVVQRLFSETIAQQEQRTISRIPDSASKHAAQAMHAV